MGSFKPVRSFVALPLLAVAFTALVPLALGQEPKGVKPKPVSSPQQSPSPEATLSRERRAAEASPEPKPGEVQPTSNSTEPTVIGKSEAPKSEIAILRDEINATTNEQARARLQLKLVNHLVSTGLKQEAIAELKLMSEEDRFDPQGFYNIANAQVRLGEWEAAIEGYHKAIRQRKGRYSRASNNLGVVLLREGRWDEAYEAFMTALRQESFRYAEASFNLGRLYAAIGQNDLAIQEWRRAVAVDPEHTAAAKALLYALRTSNIAVSSRAPRPIPRTPAPRPADHAENVLSTPSVNASNPSRGEASKPQRAGSQPQPAYTIAPETYALLQRGRTARERGRNEEAINNYRQVLGRTGGYFPPANLELAFALIALKRTDEAIEVLLPVSTRDADQFPITYYHLGRLYEFRGDLKLAEDYYNRVALAFENNSQFILDIARVQEKQGNLVGALESLERYITAMERQGQKPAWSAERLAALRQKLAATLPKPKN